MAQYVMSMLRVSKVVPPKRQIIKDISLSFFPGAKIGLLTRSIDITYCAITLPTC
jgi:ATPase subunit of ABC transporter with duplicated ATPase domains